MRWYEDYEIYFKISFVFQILSVITSFTISGRANVVCIIISLISHAIAHKLYIDEQYDDSSSDSTESNKSD